MTLVSVYRPTGEPLPAAVDFLYQLLLERPTEANISHDGTTSTARHHEFVTGKPYRRWYIVQVADGWAGAVYATYGNELGIFILKQFQRKGYATQALRTLMLELKPLPPIPAQRPSRWIAHVAPSNAASHALFKKLGGREIQITYEL